MQADVFDDVLLMFRMVLKGNKGKPTMKKDIVVRREGK